MPIRFAFLGLLLLLLSTSTLPAVISRADESFGAPPKNIKEYLDRLVQYYSETISGYDNEFVYLKNGTSSPFQTVELTRHFRSFWKSQTSPTCSMPNIRWALFQTA